MEFARLSMLEFVSCFPLSTWELEYDMAAGDSILTWSPVSNSPPTANFATLDLRNGFMVLDFDASVNEQSSFHGVLPSHYGGGQVQVVVTSTSTSGTTGNAKLRIEVTHLQAGVQLDALPAVNGSGDFLVSAPASSGRLVVTTSPVIATGGASAGEVLLLSVTRLATDTSDTMIGDLELLTLELREA